MSNKIISSEYLPYLIIGAVTILLVGLGVALLSADAPEPLTESQRNKVLVRSNSNITGNKDAKVTLVNFSDFQCPHCAEYMPIEKQLITDFGTDIRVVYRYYPINFNNPAAFPNGVIAADAAEAAGAQGKFWEMHDRIFETQEAWATLDSEEAYDMFVDLAREVEVGDIEKFEKEMREEKYRKKILKDFNDGERLGVTGTPTIFLNGEKVVDRTYEALSSDIKELLEAEK